MKLYAPELDHDELTASLRASVVSQIDATLASEGFHERVGYKPMDGELVGDADAEKILASAVAVAHFEGLGDFVFTRNTPHENEFIGHTLFNHVPLPKVIECAKAAIIAMAGAFELDALACFCPKGNRGAIALAKAVGLKELAVQPNGAWWCGTLPELVGKHRPTMERVRSAYPNEPVDVQEAAAAATICLQPGHGIWDRARLVRRAIYHLANATPVKLESTTDGQFLIFGSGSIMGLYQYERAV